MDLERIERALREGPMDEPVYVPGAFGRPHRSPWLVTLAGVALGAAVVIGLVVGVGLGVLRTDRTGDAPDPDVLAAELEGRWVSEEMTFDEWVDGLTSRGFHPNDIGNFLNHDPFEETVQYVLVFDGSQVTMQGIYDGSQPIILSSGEYTIQPDGTFDYMERTDAPPTVGEVCGAIADIQLSGDRLRFDVRDLPGCGVDPAIAHTAFFDLAPYTRGP